MTLRQCLLLTASIRWRGLKSEDSLNARAVAVTAILGPDLPVKAITSGHVLTLRAALRNRGNCGGTINRHLSALRVMMAVAQEADQSVTIPTIRMEAESEGRTRVFSTEEIGTIGWHLGKDYCDLMMFLLFSGARVGEALALEWGVFGPGAATVTFGKTKGRRPRTLPLPAPARAAVEARRGTTGGPWQGLSQSAWNHAWDAARAAAGLSDDPEAVPHSLRHTCASRLVRAGVHIQIVQAWLGHRSIATTMRYAHHDTAHLDAAAAALSG